MELNIEIRVAEVIIGSYDLVLAELKKRYPAILRGPETYQLQDTQQLFFLNNLMTFEQQLHALPTINLANGVTKYGPIFFLKSNLSLESVRVEINLT